MSSNYDHFWNNGIYALGYPDNFKYYIGLTVNFYDRFLDHQNKLKNNAHKNKELQQLFNINGLNNLTMYILQSNLNSNKELKIAEKNWAKKLPTFKQTFGGRGSHAFKRQNKPTIVSTLTNLINNYKYFFIGGIETQKQLLDKLTNNAAYPVILQSDWNAYGKDNFEFKQLSIPYYQISQYLFDNKLNNLTYNQKPYVPNILKDSIPIQL